MRVPPYMVTLMMSAAFALPTVAAAQSRAPVPAPVTFAPVAVLPAPRTVIEDPGAPFRTAIGFEALLSTTGSFNTASGYQALRNNTTGEGNTASGYQALRNNTTGFGNTAHGWQALFSHTTGFGNTAIGNAALQVNTGSLNTATGSLAMASNTTGVNNTANGYRALTSNTTASANTATGFFALDANTTGGFNTATGYQALQMNTTGSQNVAVGGTALRKTTGNNNIAVGWGAGIDTTTGSDNIFIGVNVGLASDTNTIRIGRVGGSLGQNQTFIAGIYGTQLANPAHLVVIDANGQLGTILAPGSSQGSGTVEPDAAAAFQQQLQELHAVNAELRARLARVEALLRSVSRRE